MEMLLLELFIGVVSHQASRFSVSQGPEGLAARLSDCLLADGVEVAIQVNTDDRYTPALLAIDGATVRRSYVTQFRLEARWADYLRAGNHQLSRGQRWRARRLASLVTTARIFRQWVAFFRPWHASGGEQIPGYRMVRRLVNIELSHLSLIRAGIESGATWVLIIEDDAHADDPAALAANLRSLMQSAAGSEQPSFVNLSQSFTNAELGVGYLLSPVDAFTWQGEPTRRVLAAARPITNTVCAILYRSDFLREFLPTFDSLPVDPVVPIDWKLNLALMQMFESGAIGAGDCWSITPGPIDQLSMRVTA